MPPIWLILLVIIFTIHKIGTSLVYINGATPLVAAYGHNIANVYTIDPNAPTAWQTALSKSPANKLSYLIATSTGLLYHLGMTDSEAFTEVLDLTAGSVASPVNFQATLVRDALVLMVESDIIVC